MKKIDFVRTGAGNYYGAQLREDPVYGEYGIGVCGDSAELNALAFNAITGAGFVSSEQREEKLFHNTKRIRKSKVQNAVSAALLSADKNGKEAVENLQK